MHNIIQKSQLEIDQACAVVWADAVNKTKFDRHL